MMAAMGRHADGRVRASSAGGRISLEKVTTYWFEIVVFVVVNVSHLFCRVEVARL